MDQSFIGRREELRALQNAFDSDESVFFPIYGRRRVGKSELILQFGRDKPLLYYVGKNAPETLQIREFLAESARVLDEPLLASQSAEGWKQALESVASKWKGPSKLIIAFDEYQWISAASPSLSSILQELWDRQWKRRNDMFLILCGSYMGFMEREVLGSKSPLFGRRTGQILLKPFGYKEAAHFHPQYSIVDRARAYFLCGGIPLYLRFFSGRQSIESNITGNFLDEFAPLFREPSFLLGEELRDLDNYYAVLLVLAAGSSTGTRIAEVAGIAERSLHYYLTHLVNLGYVGRRYPLTGDKPSTRQVRYCITDPLLRFWFRFVYPSESSIARLKPARAFQERVHPELESYFGSCFESFCREGLVEIYRKEGVAAQFEIGEYWSAQTQIDVVGVRKDNWTDIGECKWGRVRSAPPVERELTEKAGLYPNRRNATLGKIIFTRDPLPRREKREGFRYYSLEDMYRE